MQEQKTSNSPINITIITLTFLIPLFFLPTTLNFFATNKQALIVLAALIMLLLTSIKHLTSKTHSHVKSPLNKSLALFTGIIILNLIFNQEARTESIANRGALFIALPIITYFISTLKNNTKLLKKTILAIITSGTILSILGITQLIGLYKLGSLPLWIQTKSFTPAGSLIILASIIAVTVVTTLSWAIHTKDTIRKTSLLAAVGIQLGALISYISLMLPGKELAFQLLPYRAGWSIALDALKSGKTLLLGIGLANFPTLYTNVKPLYLNQTSLWGITPSASSNEYLQLLTTSGLLGSIAFMALAIAIIKILKDLPKSPLTRTLTYTIYSILAIFLIIPANIILYTYLFILAGLAVSLAKSTQHTTITLPKNLGLITALILLATSIYSGYHSYKVYAAELSMRNAQKYLEQNDAEGVYTHHSRAVALVPTMTNYRVSFSQINLTLASNLSQQESLSDQQREQVTILVQRAIDQARTSVQLQPSNFTVWQNLGNIYRNLINVAQGSENFAVQYYAQAVNRNPASPLLRVEYGGLFFQLAQAAETEDLKTDLLTQAAQQFQTAVQLRPTYANGYYNLAKTLELAGNIEGAYQAMQQVVGNLDPNLPDYQTALTELKSLESKLPIQETETQDAEDQQVLSEPDPLPSPLPGGPIELPEKTNQE